MKDGRFQILHVEDEYNRYLNYSRMIRGALDKKDVQYDIYQADSLENACKQVLSKGDELDLILLDISLNDNEGENGLSLVQMLRNNFLKNVPIFVVSANVGRYFEKLEQLKNKQMILGYSEPLGDDWPDRLYDILMGKQVSILHLSDIHNGRFFAYDKLIVNKEAVLDDLCKKLGYIDFLVISGDISSTNCEEDYNAAAQLLKSLGAKLSLAPHQFVFCPGNHDHDLELCDSHTFHRYLGFLKNFYGDDMPEYNHYPNYELEDYDNIRQAYSELFSIVIYPEQKTIVVGFNSVNPMDFKANREKSCTKGEGEQHCGLIFGGEIGVEQIVRIDKELKNIYEIHPDYKNFVKIAAFHHNIFEPAHIEQIPWRSTLINQGNFLSFLLKNRFIVALHGHLHYKEVHYYKSYRNQGGLNVISTGTFSGADRAFDTDFCANKITYRVSSRGQVTFLKLFQHTLSKDSIQWNQQEITLNNQ